MAVVPSGKSGSKAPTSDPEPQVRATALGEIAVADEGPENATPIICIHGIPGSSRDFRYLGPLLDGSFRVLRVEMPGFGHTPRHGVASLAAWAELPSALADALSLDRYLLLGHSFGGGAALLGAERDAGRVAGLILLASMGGRRHRGFTMSQAQFALLAALLRFPVTRWPLAFAARRRYRSIGLTPPSDWQALLDQVEIIASVDFDRLAGAARSVQVPTLSAFCQDDHLVQVSISRELCELLGNVEQLEFEDGGHHLQKSRASEIAQAIVRRFG